MVNKMRIIKVYTNDKLTNIIVEHKQCENEMCITFNEDSINVSIPKMNNIEELENILIDLIEHDIYHNVKFEVYYALKQVICNASIEYGLEVTIKY
jgi:tRNA A-37 threonylcarbamoyl transferase component Bud32